MKMTMLPDQQQESVSGKGKSAPDLEPGRATRAHHAHAAARGGDGISHNSDADYS